MEHFRLMSEENQTRCRNFALDVQAVDFADQLEEDDTPEFARERRLQKAREASPEKWDGPQNGKYPSPEQQLHLPCFTFDYPHDPENVLNVASIPSSFRFHLYKEKSDGTTRSNRG